MAIFNSLRKLYPVFTSSCTNLHSHQHKCSLFSTSIIKLSSDYFWQMPFYPVWGDITLIFICISLLISNTKHNFIYLLTIYMSSLEKCLFRSFAYFSIWLGSWALWVLYIFHILTPYQTNDLKIFSIIPCAIF